MSSSSLESSEPEKTNLRLNCLNYIKKPFNPYNNQALIQAREMALESINPIMFFSQIDYTIPYSKNYSDYFHPIMQNGQRKLFLVVLYFISLVLRAREDLLEAAFGDPKEKRIFLIYAGAAPGIPSYFLSTLFPGITFIFVDPAEFHLTPYPPEKRMDYFGPIELNPKAPPDNAIYRDYSIYLLNGYFTNELAQQFGRLKETYPRCEVLFVSDIRTSDLRVNLDAGENSEPTEFDVLWNMSMQYNWVHFMNPSYYSLKFRLPYMDVENITKTTGTILQILNDKIARERKYSDFDLSAKLSGGIIDYLNTFSGEMKTMNYLAGDLMLQPWVGKSSTEARLISLGLNPAESNSNPAEPVSIRYAEYNVRSYEDAFAYYNNSLRITPRENDCANKELHFDHCNNCAQENKIWKTYIGLIADEFDCSHVHKFIQSLSEVLALGGSKTNLSSLPHGIMFFRSEKVNLEVYNNFYNDVVCDIMANINSLSPGFQSDYYKELKHLRKF